MADGARGGRYFECGSLERLCQRLLDVASSRSGQVLPPSRLLLGGPYVDVYLPRVSVVLGFLLWLLRALVTLCPFATPLLAGGWARRVLVVC